MPEKTELDKNACCNNCNLAKRCIWRNTILVVLIALKATDAVLQAATKVCPLWTQWRPTE